LQEAFAARISRQKDPGAQGTSKNLLRVALRSCDAPRRRTGCTARIAALLEPHCCRSRRFFEVPFIPFQAHVLCA